MRGVLQLVRVFAGEQLAHALGLHEEVWEQLALQHKSMTLVQRLGHVWYNADVHCRILRGLSRLVRLPVIGRVVVWFILFLLKLRLKIQIGPRGALYALKRLPRADLLSERESELALTAQKCPF
jgi:hypothetical protein